MKIVQYQVPGHPASKGLIQPLVV